MKLYNIVFSPCGGTQKIANIIAKSLTDKAVEVDLSNPDFIGLTLEKESLAIIANPSYGGRVPPIVLERLKKIRGDQAKAILVVSFGNRAIDDTLLELYEETKKVGFLPFAAIEAVSHHTLFTQFAVGRPDDKDTAELKEFTKVINKKLEAKEFSFSNPLKGNSPYKTFNGCPIKPVGNSKCIKCLKCVTSCPVKAINKETPRATDKTKCISCMRCVSICPTQARHGCSLLLKIASTSMKKEFEVRKPNKLHI